MARCVASWIAGHLGAAGRPITLVVCILDTVESVKQKIQDKESIPPDLQRLLFSSQEHDDGQTLLDCGVETESTITLVLRLRGGMYEESSSRRDTTRRLKLRTANGLTLDVDWAHETVEELQTKAAELSRLKVDQGTDEEEEDDDDDEQQGADESTAEYASRLLAALRAARKIRRAS